MLIREILVLVTQYFEDINCLKIIEYLLRNFDIHLFDASFMIINFMAFHSTSPYTKLL